ncbi:MAG TPA: ferrochelatase [Acidimicrobiales bacterium]|nr:ferrochelatase [Acidimicrobiales bacterium]
MDLAVPGTATRYDALLVVSFGGPEGMDDVVPFMENVTRGRGIPRERLVEVSRHYALFDGVSPINGQNRALVAALTAELAGAGIDLPVYWGNRNWDPLLADTVAAMARDGVERALAFVTSAYSSYSGCRQYREDVARACAEVGPVAPVIEKLRGFHDHPGFVEPNADNVRAALERVPAARRDGTPIAFTAHSIPTSMADSSDYQAQLLEVCTLVASRLDGNHPWALVWQSRSGPPSQPWLEPDIVDHIEALHAGGATDLVVAPIGFVSDHMEVVYDLDTEATGRAEELGLSLVRAATAGTDPRFVAMVRELVQEQLDPSAPRRALASGPRFDTCHPACCHGPTRPPRA